MTDIDKCLQCGHKLTNESEGDNRLCIYCQDDHLFDWPDDELDCTDTDAHQEQPHD